MIRDFDRNGNEIVDFENKIWERENNAEVYAAIEEVLFHDLDSEGLHGYLHDSCDAA